jgi:hypothetical protein
LCNDRERQRVRVATRQRQCPDAHTFEPQSKALTHAAGAAVGVLSTHEPMPF